MSSNNITSRVAEMVACHSSDRKEATSTIGAVIECVVGAASPLVSSGMFTGGTMQDRLLFTLVLAGACASLADHSDSNFELRVSVTPETLREAFDVFTRLTDKDIQHHLPKPMVAFAAQRVLN